MLAAAHPDTELEDARRLRAAFRALVRRFSVSERANDVCCGMSVAQAATLQTLSSEGALRQGELGRRLGVTPSTLTRNLSRLEEARLVERRPEASDRRATRVVLTRAGHAAAARIEMAQVRFAQDILERLPAQRRGEVLRGLTELLGALREATESCCPGAYDHLMRDLPCAAPADAGDTEGGSCNDEGSCRE
jgi:DNA-binding MarR family transcriptional regulator